MPTAVLDREQIRLRDYERHEANRRFEETTDLAERLGFPIRTTIAYDLIGGSLYARTDQQMRPFTERTFQAKQEAPYLFTGDQAFEAARRSHEHDEAVMVEALARGELDGNVLIKVSKIPDAVVEGSTSIKGYKRQSLRTFVRVYQRDGSVVNCTLFSIDRNDVNGLDQIGKLIDMPLTGRNSEDILADCRLLNVPGDAASFVDELVDRSVLAYDDAIYQRTGERTNAGSLFIDQMDAQSAVESQGHLLREHFMAITTIAGMALNNAAKEDLYDIERERAAAAISLACRGHEISSSSDASVSDEVQRGDYSRDCTTATENAMQQGESDLLKDWIKVVEACPLCGAKKVVAAKTGEIISGSCGCHLNVCTGKSWKDEPAKHVVAETASVIPSKEQSKRLTDERLVRRCFGASALLKTRTTVGGGYYEITDKSGNVITTLKDKKELYALAV